MYDGNSFSLNMKENVMEKEGPFVAKFDADILAWRNDEFITKVEERRLKHTENNHLLGKL
jgi:hypothetical protein